MIGHVCKQRLLCYADEEEEVDSGALDEYAEDTIVADTAHIHSM